MGEELLHLWDAFHTGRRAVLLCGALVAGGLLGIVLVPADLFFPTVFALALLASGLASAWARRVARGGDAARLRERYRFHARWTLRSPPILLAAFVVLVLCVLLLVVLRLAARDRGVEVPLLEPGDLLLLYCAAGEVVVLAWYRGWVCPRTRAFLERLDGGPPQGPGS